MPDDEIREAYCIACQSVPAVAKQRLPVAPDRPEAP
jgi:hypothetical protein